MTGRPDAGPGTSIVEIGGFHGLRQSPEISNWLGAGLIGLGVLLGFHGARTADHRLLAVGVSFSGLGRGIALRRPVMRQNVLIAGALFILALVAAAMRHSGVSELALALIGAAALSCAPVPAVGSAADRRHVWSLVNATSDDCLAPFALRLDKSYVFSRNGKAALAYRVRLGVAVVSGDPFGDPGSQGDAVRRFLELADTGGWRVGVLGAGPEWTEFWREHGMRALPIGRDVVIDVGEFAMTGRRFRNLRQAVQRTRNAGVTTAIYRAGEVPASVLQHMNDLVAASKRSSARGFSMILDGLLTDAHPGILYAVAFDRDGELVAFHRFATADGGREISQDLPWRRVGAPNGVDERLAYDAITWARENDARRVSLSFAAFPELYEDEQRSVLMRAAYWGSHRLDRFIRLESLYRYLRKFHALANRRYVLLRLRDLLPVAVAMLTLEFMAIRRRG